MPENDDDLDDGVVTVPQGEKKEEKVAPEPPPDHPRWNEVYGKWKHTERELATMKEKWAEREEDLKAIREHNEKLAQALEKKADRTPPPEPDPDVDPEGHKKWVSERNEEKQKVESEEKQKERLSMLIEIQKDVHEDYDTVVELAEKAMKKDKELMDKVWKSPNPPREAYRLGKRMLEEKNKVENDKKAQEDAEKSEKEAKEKSEKDRKNRIDAGEVESSSGDAPPENKEIKLTKEQRRVVRQLFPDMDPKKAEERYIAQLKEMGGV